MSKTSVLGTGLSGLVGSKFVEMNSELFEFTNLDLATGVDITNLDSVKAAVVDHPAEVVVHFAAFTDVSKAYEEKDDKDGIVYKVNVGGTEHIVQAVKESGKRLIHISTAYVFDGKKEGLYTEEDSMNPIEWYGRTKAWAEEAVLSAGISAAIFRIDQPYRQDEFPKLDILHRIKKGLEEGTLPPMFINHTFTATKIEQFADTLKFAIQNPLEGIFHATTDPVTTDYQFAMDIQKQFGLKGEIKPGDLNEYLKRTNRPYQKNTALDTTKLKEKMKS
ncbi:MAG: sugar nucleotide-binding protein [Patescibacteria group bacterium]